MSADHFLSLKIFNVMILTLLSFFLAYKHDHGSELIFQSALLLGIHFHLFQFLYFHVSVFHKSIPLPFLALLDYASTIDYVRRPSVHVAITFSEPTAQISFKFWLLLPLSHTLRRFFFEFLKKKIRGEFFTNIFHFR